MKRPFLLIIALAFSGYLFPQSISPDVVASAGDYFSNGTVSISWTLGEVATETIGNGTNILTQGFQQPNYTSVIGAVPTYLNPKFEVSLYPNPSTDYVKLTIKGNDDFELQVSLYDAIGRQLLTSKIAAGVTDKTIDMSSYHSGIYFVKISQTNGEGLKTIQVAKIK
jgi:Secretion system C-terminal sorting domain